MLYAIVPVGSSVNQNLSSRDLDDNPGFDFSQNSIQIASATTATGKYFL